jgi:hypothetical protein
LNLRLGLIGVARLVPGTARIGQHGYRRDPRHCYQQTRPVAAATLCSYHINAPSLGINEHPAPLDQIGVPRGTPIRQVPRSFPGAGCATPGHASSNLHAWTDEPAEGCYKCSRQPLPVNTRLYGFPACPSRGHSLANLSPAGTGRSVTAKSHSSASLNRSISAPRARSRRSIRSYPRSM